MWSKADEGWKLSLLAMKMFSYKGRVLECLDI